jgi:hypothetical protein
MLATVRQQVRALSLGRSVWARLGPHPVRGQITAVFERACILSPAEGEPFSLVLPEIGDGPLNVVVPGAPGCFARLRPGTACYLSDRRLRAGDLGVDLAAARVWEPRPPWHRLRAHLSQVVSQLEALRAGALQAAPAGSLLSLLPGEPQAGDAFTESVWVSARQAAFALRAAWSGDQASLRTAAVQLAGLGPGLTPAGDDFLAGAMLWAWLAHPTPQEFCQALVSAAAPRTTALSAAFLRAAGHGECSAAWHALFEQLAAPEAGPAGSQAVARVLSYGHTSGADALAGFLWMGTGPQSQSG